MKFIVTVKEFSKTTNSKTNEWESKCDSLAEALRLVKKLNEKLGNNNHTFNYNIAEVL